MNRRNFLKTCGVALGAFFFSLETFLGLFGKNKYGSFDPRWREVHYDYMNKKGIATAEVMNPQEQKYNDVIIIDQSRQKTWYRRQWFASRAEEKLECLKLQIDDSDSI